MDSQSIQKTFLGTSVIQHSVFSTPSSYPLSSDLIIFTASLTHFYVQLHDFDILPLGSI